MKKTILLPLAIVVGCTITGCKKEDAAAPKSGSVPSASFPQTRKTSFEEVTSQLDPGGTLFAYLSTEQWLSDLAQKISSVREVVLGLPTVGRAEQAQVNQVFDLLVRLTQSSGVQELTGAGMSAAQVSKELYRSKFILHHRAGSGQGFLWSMFGRAPHPLRGLEMLPPHTGFAAFGDIDLAQVWKVVEQELAKSGVPEAEQAAREWPQMFEAKTKLSWAKLLSSLGGEMGLLVTLDPARKINLPSGGNAAIDLPEPALLVAVKVNDDLLFDRVTQELRDNPQAVLSNEPGLKLCVMPLPIPLPLPLQIVVASSGDYFFLATSADLVRQALATRQGKQPGLRTTPEFLALAKLAPAEGNSFTYASPRLSQTIQEIQKQALRNGAIPGAKAELTEKLFFGGEPAYGLTVASHTATGWHVVAVGNRDSSTVALMLPAVGGVGVLAGLTLPALAKAKSKAQTISSVSQLKQVCLAARIYANDHNDAFPPAENWCDALKDELGTFKILKAPADTSSGACSYAYNAKLSRMDEGKINPQTVAFFETAGGWNQHGGRELLIPAPRQGGVYVIGFADGSVRQVPASQIDQLRWNP
jgi:type II secretory pathway pseudopilin PulG